MEETKDEILTLSKVLEQSMDEVDMSEFDGLELPEGVTAEDIKTFIMLVGLPDAEFALVAPMVLENIEKGAKDPLLISQYLTQLKANGGTIDDILITRDEIVKGLSDIEGITQEKLDFIGAVFDIYHNAAAEYLGTSTITVPIQLMSEEVKLPEYAHLTDSGMDVYALEDITIAPGETKLVPTGIKVAIPEGYEIQVRPKSGRCLKTKLRVANTPGTIDAGYRDEIGVIIDNIEPPIKKIDYEWLKVDNMIEQLVIKDIEPGSSYTIGKGEKFAQLVLIKVPHIVWNQVEDINLYSGDRGGGFGSTGTK